jgi:2'-5' RNA ligase
VPTPGPFDIHVRGLGWFPNPHTPRIFWATVDAPEALKQLAAGTDQALSQLGIEIEKRPYSPHLTLARVERGTPVGGLRQAVAQLDFADFGSFRAEHFTLYQSKTGPKGSLYTSLAEYPL